MYYLRDNLSTRNEKKMFHFVYKCDMLRKEGSDST